MALTNQQYEAIMKDYEQRQTRNRHLQQERLLIVYKQLPEYRELEDKIGAVSVDYTKRFLEGKASYKEELHNTLAELSARKKKLLCQAGFSQDYLNPIYDCPDCQDTGYLLDSRQKCHCFRQKELTLLYEQSNIQGMIEKENFSTLSYQYYQGEDLERFRSAEKISHEFVKNFLQDYHNLFFYGTVGTGKSFLSGCIAKELLQQGYSVIYFSSSSLFDTLAKYSFDGKNKEALSHFHKDLYNCDLIIIDDLGTEITNTFVTSQLFACLNERHLRKKSTIISTNLNLEDLRNRYSDRIFSRVTSNFTICKLTGPDIRMYKKRMSLQHTLQ